MRATEVISLKELRNLLAAAAQREIMDTVQAAEYLGLSQSSLVKMRAEGNGPHFAKIGRHVRYRRATIDEWVISRERTRSGKFTYDMLPPLRTSYVVDETRASGRPQ